MWTKAVAFLSWLGFAWARRRLDDEARREHALHLEWLVDRYVHSGMTPEQAHAAARRQFGNPTWLREEMYRMNGIGWFDTLRQDLRQACRLMLRRRALTIGVAATLGVGVGITSAIFSLIYALLLRPFPYPQPEQLVRIYSVPERNIGQRGALAVPEMEVIRARSESLQGVGLFMMFDTNLGGDAPAQSVKIAWVTPGLFELTGVAPMLGRTFAPADDRLGGENHKVVLSHHIWRNRFGSDPDILGKQVRMRLLSYTVIGVMPPGYRFPSNADVWAPIQSYLNKFDRPLRLDWNARTFNAIARLRPGVTLQQAAADLRTLGAHVAVEQPGSNRDLTYDVISLRTAEVGGLRPYLTLLGIAVAAVLLIACANIASLLLTHALARAREFVVRTALGAARTRIVRQLVTESVLLALLGGTCGLAVASLATRALVALVPVDLPAWIRIEINWPVLLFGLGVTVLTGLVFGLAPAVEAARADLQTTLRPSSGGSPRTGALRKGLIVVEVALSCVLLVISGLMLKAFLLLYTSAPGFDTKHLLTAFISPHRVGTTAEMTHAYWLIYNRTLEHLSRTPGVIAAGGATSVPYAFNDNERPRSRMQIRRRGDGGDPQQIQAQIQAWTSQVSPNYFSTMGIPLLAGRDFTEGDTIDRECVVVISARTAERVWGGTRALGETAQFGWDSTRESWCRVVGIVGNVRYRGSDDDQGGEVYWSYRQREAGSFYLVARTHGDPLDYGSAVREAVTMGDPETGVISITSMESAIGESLWRRRLWGVLLGAFAALAVALAAIGLYSILAHSVRGRTREMGIRAALGARRLDAIAVVCREAAALVLAGVILGLIGASFAARAMATLIFQVQPYDPSIFIGTPLVLAAIATLACLFPARRAASVDAAIALRHDE
jgi:putative ABC transport system permease protein